MMRAWSFDHPAPAGDRRMKLTTREVAKPLAGEVLVKIEACGLCRTDLHLLEGDLTPRRPHVVPGHQVVGTVVGGTDQDRFVDGDRVGVAWLRSTCGTCRWCRNGAENLCPSSAYTGWDADGGLAEYIAVPAAYAYRLPKDADAVKLAPLLCAGIIGYRALRRANLPPGGRLGIYGFGSSAHITAQIARASGAELHVMTRGEGNRELARRLGATFVGDAHAIPNEPLDSAIVFAPAGEIVPIALRAVRRGGTVAIAGIYVSTIPALDYETALFYERDLRSVTSNTRSDGEELLRISARVGLDVHTTTYGFEEVDGALDDLAHGRVAGSAVVSLG